MRSFFSRRPQPRKAKNARSDSAAWAEITANPIATIDHLGPTAVATLTVSALAKSGEQQA